MRFPMSCILPYKDNLRFCYTGEHGSVKTRILAYFTQCLGPLQRRIQNPSNISYRAFVMRCAIWYHLYSLKNMKNTHGGVLILVRLQALLKSTLLHGYFSCFLNCTNGTTSHNAPHLMKIVNGFLFS